ncbi:DeoR/GlpR family DNA-binding transcription regulator [Kineosporia mesophila]|uniref:DeoR/GlpR family DNA-binding transcription regulator n=3 Tax=Kineosporia mesophila TaxID=566012 RepID=A0ABP7AM92_9ACTN
MNRHARLSALLDLMGEAGHVDAVAVARQLDVSASTIRRDLNYLHDQQLVTRTRGGAVATTISYDLPIRYRSAGRRGDKARIGEAAARLVGVHDIVGLNGGSTTTEVARALAAREWPDQRTAPLTIVTNAINIAGELTVRRHVKLVMTGGVARAQAFELTGPLASGTLAQITLDWAIIGVNALDPAAGARASDEDEAQVNRLMVERAGSVAVVADSSKLRARAFAHICPVQDIDVVVTDVSADPGTVRQLRAQGVQVMLA